MISKDDRLAALVEAVQECAGAVYDNEDRRMFVEWDTVRLTALL